MKAHAPKYNHRTWTRTDLDVVVVVETTGKLMEMGSQGAVK
jgi:hypothetical protein